MSFVDIPASHGRLEGLFWQVENPVGAALVCHPHPMHGGTMHNHITYRMAQAFRDRRISALRFNFRGVGRSTGTYDDGRGEVTDAKEALDFLQRSQPGVPLYVGGFSFGCRTGLQLTIQDERVERMLAVGLGVDVFDVEFVTQLRKRTAFIHADRDEYGTLKHLRALLERVPGPTQLFELANSDHLATGRLDAFSAVAATALDWLLAK